MQRVRAAGLEGLIAADSAGTGDWHVGEAPHPGTMRVLRDRGIEYAHQARTLRRADFDDFDLILTMDDENFRSVVRRGNGRAQVRRFLEYAADCATNEVPDPWYTGDFEQTYELVSSAADGLLEHLRSTHGI